MLLGNRSVILWLKETSKSKIITCCEIWGLHSADDEHSSLLEVWCLVDCYIGTSISEQVDAWTTLKVELSQNIGKTATLITVNMAIVWHVRYVEMSWTLLLHHESQQTFRGVQTYTWHIGSKLLPNTTHRMRDSRIFEALYITSCSSGKNCFV